MSLGAEIQPIVRHNEADKKQGRLLLKKQQTKEIYFWERQSSQNIVEILTFPTIARNVNIKIAFAAVCYA